MIDIKKAAVRNSDFLSLGVVTPIVFDQHIIIGGQLGFACSFISAIIL